MQFLERLVTKKRPDECQTDLKMHRRQYQKSTSDIKMPHHYCGYTNRILIQRQKKNENYYIPVYVIFKIKSIQDLDIQKLVGSISCVIIINVLIQNLSEPLVHLLETQMNIQLNRSELIQLKENNENGISCVNSGKFLRFTIRKNVTGAIIQDTLWSPFQIISLATGFTFNSIKKEGAQIFHSYYKYKQQLKAKEQQKTQGIIAQLGEMFIEKDNKKKDKDVQKQIIFDNTKNYTFSFNNMRNGSQIPISYSLGCGYALYDLAQRRLESYHTNLDSYSQVIRKYEEEQEKKHSKKQESKDKKPEQVKDKKKDDTKDKKKEDSKEKSQLKQSKGSVIKKPVDVIPEVPMEIEVEQHVKKSVFDEFVTDIYKVQKGEKKQKAPKAKYYQFSHFVIPLYKYPVNSLLTIFIPIFLLALLSLAIFFQDNDLSSRIGSIATMVLGYIALIPSIKEQLPPSSKITVIERVIYVSTMCCLFSLVQSFLIDGDSKYTFVWYKNQLFMLCLLIHISVFVFVGILLVIHLNIWEPSYNYSKDVQSPDPEKERHAWINVYCDEEFYKVNSKIYKNNLGDQKAMDKTKGMYIKYIPKYKKIVQQDTKDVFLGLLSKSEVANNIQDKSAVTEITNLLKQEKKQEKPAQKIQSQSNTQNLVTDLLKPEGVKEQEKAEKKSSEKQKKVQQKKGEKQEKKNDKQSKPKKAVLKLKHQDSLQFLDELIKSGSHISFKEKEKSKSKSAAKPNDPMKASTSSIKSSTSSIKNSKID